MDSNRLLNDSGSIERMATATVRLIESFDAVLRLEPEWRRLEGCAPEVTPFQSFDWCRAWLEATRAAAVAETVRIVAVYEGDRLRLLWPLAIRRLWGFRVAHWLAEPLTQYGDALVDSMGRTTWLRAAWDEIRAWSDIDTLELRRIRADAAVMALPEIAAEAGRHVDAAPFLDLRGAGSGQVRTSRTRNTLRRRLKQLDALGPVRFEILAPGAERKAVEEALRLKARWLEAKSLASVGLSHSASAACLLALAERGRLLIGRLSVADETAAVEVGLVHKARYASFMQGYDQRFAAHGPGRLLFWQMIERCPDLGIEVFDFLAPAYEHKREWASGETPIGDFIVPCSRKGVAAASYLARIRPALKEIYAKLPAGARRRVSSLVGALS